MFKIALIAILSTAPIAGAAQARFTLSGGAHTPVELTPDRNSGLEAVFVADASQGGAPLSVTYTPSSAGAAVTWSRFSNLGGGFAEPIEGARGYTLSSLQPDMGYIVTEGGRQHCFWVADYGARPCRIEGVAIGESDCATITLIPDGEAERMVYYSVNGRAIEIDREITVGFTSMTYDSGLQAYTPTEERVTAPYLRPQIHVDAPLTSTAFTIEGDRFLRAWGLTESATSPTTDPIAVTATATATQTDTERPSNEQGSGEGDSGESLGGSAPCTVALDAAVTPAALFTEWQMASDPDFTDITLRFPDPVMDYTFTESGTTYLRFIAANADGGCEYVSPTYSVSIGESALMCPNAFTPGTSEGVNDEWRVSYRSIVKFDCHIFSRSGRRVARLTDPSQGWDGRIGGKLAPAGVYYYVITAEGSDGKSYKLSGDINLIGYR